MFEVLYAHLVYKKSQFIKQLAVLIVRLRDQAYVHAIPLTLGTSLRQNNAFRLSDYYNLAMML